MKIKKLLALLMALVMMASLAMTSAFAEDTVDPDSKPIVDWNYILDNPDSYWHSELVKNTPLSGVSDHYDPLGAVQIYYKGPVSGWEGLQYGGMKPIYHTSLSQFDGICFYVNVSEEHKFDPPVMRFVVDGQTYGYSLGVMEKGDNLFYYVKWDQFVQDADGATTLTNEMMEGATAEFAIYNGKWNTTEDYHPASDFVISDIYGYKTNGSEDVDDYTFYIPHDPSVKNLPNYFADRIPHPDLAAQIDAAYKAANALKDKAASSATKADVDLIQNFLDLYDSANSGTKDLLAEQYGITKDPNADVDSWYALDAIRQTFIEEIAYQESIKNRPTTPGGSTGTQAVAKKPAKVKKVTAKSKTKKKVVVTWKAAKNAKKYNVKYSYKKNMKKAKTVTVKKLKVTLKKLKSGKKIYIQVRGVNGKVKGNWSAKKAVKVK